MKTNDIKKGTKIRTKQLGVSVSGVMMDNLKGNTRLIKTNGTEIGMYDEMGSVYVNDIKYEYTKDIETLTYMGVK